MRTAEQRRHLRAVARRLARAHDGVVHRSALRRAGIDRHLEASEVAAGRWARHGRMTVAVHTGVLVGQAPWWRAVWEAGPHAVLDGVSALQAGGLTGFTDDVVHVSLPPGSRVRRISGVVVHHRRDLDPAAAVGSPPRVRAAEAAVTAAHWARSDRQAALLLCLVVQQRLTTGDRLLTAARGSRGRTRRAVVRAVAADVADGAHSLGELDFARRCRLRGLPEPERQVVVRGPRGRLYLDVRWRRVPLVVEIDGAQHRQGLSVGEDHLRRNRRTIAGEYVLGIDLVGLRLRGEEFLDQVEAAYLALVRRAA